MLMRLVVPFFSSGQATPLPASLVSLLALVSFFFSIFLKNAERRNQGHALEISNDHFQDHQNSENNNAWTQ